MRQALLLFTVCSLVAAKAWTASPYPRAQEPPALAFLQNTVVADMEEDAWGFVWLATYNGLYRFDGSQARLMRGGYFEDIDRIPGSPDLLITERYGLLRYRYAVDQFDLFASDSLWPTKANLHNTWLAGDSVAWVASDGGLVRLNLNTGKHRLLPLLDATAKSYTAVAVVPDPASDDHLWVGTSNGCLHVSRSTGQHTLLLFEDPDPAMVLRLNSVDEMLALDDRIYIGTWGAGVIELNPGTQSYTNFYISQSEGTPTRDHVYHFLKTAAGDVWAGSTIGALLIKRDGTREVFHGNGAGGKNGSNALASPIAPVLIDRQGRTWIGYHMGVQVADPINDQFGSWRCPLMDSSNYFIPRKVLENADRTAMYFGMDFSWGLYRYEPASGEWGFLPASKAASASGRKTKPGQRKEFRVWDMLWTGDTLWILEENGLYRYRAGTDRLEKIPMQETEGYNMFRRFSLGPDGVFWISSWRRGLFRFDPRNGRWETAQQLKERRFPELVKNVKWLHPLQNGSMLLYWRDNLWQFQASRGDSIGTFRSLGGAVNNGDPFIDIHDVVESRDHIWLATSYAVYRFNRTDLKLKITDSNWNPSVTAEKVLKGTFFEIVVDSMEGLWATWGKTLFHFEKDKNQARRYTARDGLFSSPRHGYELLSTLSDGRILVGGRGSFAAFSPSELATNPEIPVPYISHLLANGVPYKTDSNAVLSRRFHFAPDQRSVTLAFSALAFSSPEDIRYEYRLVGVDAEWRSTTNTLSQPTYTNLKGGRYRFELRAANSSLLASPVRTWILHFRKKWWEFHGVQAGTGIFFLGLVLGGFRWRGRTLRRRNKLALEMAELEKQALQANMNPHFIFNALNSIQQLIVAGDEPMSLRYLGRFSKLLRGVLDSASMTEITLEKELELLDHYLQLEALRFEGRFTYDIVLPPDLPVDDMRIPGFLIQPIVENAIHHGLLPLKGKGQVTVTFVDRESYLGVIVEDNGIGRQAARHQRSTHQDHVSKGLSLIRSRIALVNRVELQNVVEIEDLSGAQTGTRVRLKIPLL